MEQPKLWPRWLRCVVQSLLVAVFMLVAFAAVYRFHSRLCVASLAASAVIAFGFPNAQSARVRFLLGGYACGITAGLAAWFGLWRLMPEGSAVQPVWQILFSVLGVTLVALAMFGLNLQHPPAAALALGIVVEQNPLWMVASAFGCVVVLCGMRWLVMRALGKYFPN